MTLVLDDLRTELRAHLGVDSTDLPDASADLLINRSYWEISDKFPFRAKEATSTVSTVASTRRYAMPAPFEALRFIALEDENGKHFHLERWVRQHYETQYVNDTDTRGQPTNYFREADDFILYPTPDAVFALTVGFWSIFDDLSASDTTVEGTVRGLSFGGLDTIERITLNGTTVIKGKAEFRRILDIALSAAAVGTVTISKQSDSSSLRTVAAGITRYTTLFKFAYPLEGDDLVRYEKVFVKNTHGADALSEAAIALVSDSSVLSVGVAASQGDSVTIANRRAAPSGITFESADEYVDITGTNLNAGSSLGIWLKQTLPMNHKITEANSSFIIYIF